MDNLVFEERVNAFVERMNTELQGIILGLLKPRMVSCDAEELSVTLAYPGQIWQCNSNGVIHGGIVGTMIDIAMGTLTHAICGGLTPTINLNVNYLHSADIEQELLVKAHAVRAGHTIIFTTAEAWNEQPTRKIVATASGTLRNFEG